MTITADDRSIQYLPATESAVYDEQTKAICVTPLLFSEMVALVSWLAGQECSCEERQHGCPHSRAIAIRALLDKRGRG